MPLVETTLVANTVASVTLDEPSEQIVVTIESGTAAEVYVTSDGSNPVIPSSGVEVTDNQASIPAEIGGQIVVRPSIPDGHQRIVTVKLLSAGTPTVQVSW